MIALMVTIQWKELFPVLITAVIYIYVMWSDKRNSTNNTDIFIIKSEDGGASWSQRKMVNIDAYDGVVYPAWMEMKNKEMSVWTAKILDEDFNKLG